MGFVYEKVMKILCGHPVSAMRRAAPQAVVGQVRSPAILESRRPPPKFFGEFWITHSRLSAELLIRRSLVRAQLEEPYKTFT